MSSDDRDLVYADDWFIDREGRTWSVRSINLAKREVTLRMVHPPERTVTFEDLKANFELGGLRKFRQGC